MRQRIVERLQSRWVWISIIAQVVLILSLYAPQVADNVKIVSVAVVEMFTIIGVLNNPADKENF